MEALSADLKRKVKALVSGGYYASEIEVIKDAVKRLFREDVEMNINAAMELYRKEQVSLSKASELAVEMMVGLASDNWQRTDTPQIPYPCESVSSV